MLIAAGNGSAFAQKWLFGKAPEEDRKKIAATIKKVTAETLGDEAAGLVF